MTRSKHLKKEIRERARKTGERYTAARRQVLIARKKKTADAPKRAAASPPARAAAKLGLSEKAVLEKTGHGYDHWFAVLDAYGSMKGHTAFVEHLNSAHGVPGWHAQGIVVAYERVRGLRVMNQSCDGTFQVTVSKAVPAAVGAVADALADPKRRRVWLAGADTALVRTLEGAFTGPRPKAVRVKSADLATLRYKWDATTIDIRITSKKGGGATIAIGNIDLPDAASVEPRRAQWKAALDALKAHLTS
jgi:hypothetical protein